MANYLDEIVDFKQFFFKLIQRWHLFLFSLFFAFIISYGYNRYSVEYFKVETSILIEDENSIATATDLLYDKVNSKNKILENKELMIKSYPLIYNTLSELSFNIAYFIEGNTFDFITNATTQAWIIVIYLAIGMNVIGYSCWYSVLSRNPVNNVMSVLLLFPVTGLLTSIFILNETPNTYAYFGGAIIISGVAMILINKKTTKIK